MTTFSTLPKKIYFHQGNTDDADGYRFEHEWTSVEQIKQDKSLELDDETDIYVYELVAKMELKVRKTLVEVPIAPKPRRRVRRGKKSPDNG